MLFIYNGSKREQITVLWCNLASNKSHYAGKTVKCKMDLMLHLNPPLLMNGLWINSPHLHFRTLKSPKTGTRQCSNRYTEYPVRGKTSTFDVFLCWLSRPVCVCVSKCVCMLYVVYVVCYVTLCSVSPSLCSEPIEENPYRPTYIFPDNSDIQMRSKGIRWQCLRSCWLYWSAATFSPSSNTVLCFTF